MRERRFVYARSIAIITTIALAAACSGELSVGRAAPGAAREPGSDAGSGGGSGPGGASDGGADGRSGCLDVEGRFVREIYAGVLAADCQSCHNAQGLASGTDFVLISAREGADYVERNLETFRRVARREAPGGGSLALAKASGAIGHGGGAPLAPDSVEYEALAAFIDEIDGAELCAPAPRPDILADLIELDDDERLRRAALDLVGRLPTDEERAALAEDRRTLVELIDQMMEEDAFLEIFVDEGLNDVFLLEGSIDLNAAVLDGEDFPDRQWYDSLNLEEETRARHRDAASIGLRGQAYALLRHIVSNDLPFTGVLTADYTMVNYASARSYGVADQVDFKGREDLDEYQPARLAAPSRSEAGGMFPHAGIVTTHAYLDYYSTTETNRNRGRARAFYAQFLDTNLLEIAEQGGGDSQAVAALENPVRDAAECSVCHYTIDPAAGAFQNFDEGGDWRPRGGGWYTDTFAPGFGEKALPQDRTDSALRWFAEQVAEDPRFARAMVANAYQAVMGRRPMAPPLDPSRAAYLGELDAFAIQQEWLRGVERAFIDSDYNIKTVVRQIVLSPYYGARRTERDREAAGPELVGAYEGLGLARLLTPEQLDRRIEAIFGERWVLYGRYALTDSRSFYMLYAGIDSVSVTTRLGELSPLMASIATIMAGDVACQLGVRELERPASERLLLAEVEPEETGEGDDGAIRAAIVALYDRILGERVAPQSEDVQIARDLFVAVRRDGRRAVEEGREYAHLEQACGGAQDPLYTRRAWMAVITFMLEDWAFLHH